MSPVQVALHAQERVAAALHLLELETLVAYDHRQPLAGQRHERAMPQPRPHADFRHLAHVFVSGCSTIVRCIFRNDRRMR
ncbi:hypothetical protein [Burkholderia vietnamiensis]|uniref:hypothetical protein n=1 Tax=Burkholderia vietnamiensis TaxID=60552 RepID=UPI001CF3C5B1|nr:hypothetical protein [Burkholderia vietnamiensis]MCA8210419.1 hypothetical protein [Burkholderia vietnamiensis]